MLITRTSRPEFVVDYLRRLAIDQLIPFLSGPVPVFDALPELLHRTNRNDWPFLSPCISICASKNLPASSDGVVRASRAPLFADGFPVRVVTMILIFQDLVP